MEKLIVILGTTAAGKSDIGIRLAQKFNGEIISADSRQVFRGLDLGSGKVTKEEQQMVPHHLIDVCEPGDFFSMADFQKLGYAAIEDVLQRGKTPFLVGGTGLYVDAITQGYQLSDKMPDLAYRAELEKLTTPELYAMLMEKLPGYQVDAKNRNRVMRVLEKLHDGDDAIPSRSARYDCLLLGVNWEREVLKKRIDERLEKRFRMGMIDEIRGLMDKGVSTEFLLGLGLEYRYITQYILGDIPSMEKLTEELGNAIKRFARRQMTWFRRHGDDIHWLDMTCDPDGEAEALIRAFLQK
ncbi:MAG: tRNA (adenosine(37)-N6)-dimethylallyltransferase MiaA [Clostridiales bacterium]|nr:tRNA (adenosine(37)-N6)-dimethylallyltransferase MiaA [Clostridiales bacterium]